MTEETRQILSQILSEIEYEHTVRKHGENEEDTKENYLVRSGLGIAMKIISEHLK